MAFATACSVHNKLCCVCDCYLQLMWRRILEDASLQGCDLTYLKAGRGLALSVAQCLLLYPNRAGSASSQCWGWLVVAAFRFGVGRKRALLVRISTGRCWLGLCSERSFFVEPVKV